MNVITVEKEMAIELAAIRAWVENGGFSWNLPTDGSSDFQRTASSS